MLMSFVESSVSEADRRRIAVRSPSATLERQPPKTREPELDVGLLTATTADNSAPTEFVCGTKRTCKQMRSCEEATFHLKQCGVLSLDGDKDGIPCNKLCGGR